MDRMCVGRVSKRSSEDGGHCMDESDVKSREVSCSAITWKKQSRKSHVSHLLTRNSAKSVNR